MNEVIIERPDELPEITKDMAKKIGSDMHKYISESVSLWGDSYLESDAHPMQLPLDITNSIMMYTIGTIKNFTNEAVDCDIDGAKEIALANLDELIKHLKADKAELTN